MTQGNSASPTIFNIVVDMVVRAVLDVVCGPQESQHGLVWASGERNLVFYPDGGRMVGQDHAWVQDALAMTVAMFCRMGLNTNLEKTKYMVCKPGFIWGKWVEKAYKRQTTGEGENLRERKNTWVSCTK